MTILNGWKMGLPSVLALCCDTDCRAGADLQLVGKFRRAVIACWSGRSSLSPVSPLAEFSRPRLI